jgi:hypothetical protein
VGAPLVDDLYIKSKANAGVSVAGGKAVPAAAAFGFTNLSIVGVNAA